MKFSLPLTHPVQIVMGFIIWSLWLVAVYAGLSLGCMVSASPEDLGPLSWLNIILLAFTLLVSAFLLRLSYRCWQCPVPEGQYQKQHRFTLRLAAGVYLAGAVATLAAGLPVIALPPCL